MELRSDIAYDNAGSSVFPAVRGYKEIRVTQLCKGYIYSLKTFSIFYLWMGVEASFKFVNLNQLNETVLHSRHVGHHLKRALCQKGFCYTAVLTMA